MLKNIKRLLFTFDYEPIELFSSMLLISWGIWVYNISIFSASQSFNAMSQIANEQTWGMFLFILGILYFTFIIFDDHKDKSYIIRKLLAILTIITWTFVSIVFYLSGTGTVGTITYMVIAIFNFWAYVRLK